MYDSKVVFYNNEYGKNKPNVSADQSKKLIFHNSSNEHLTITAIDPEKGTSIDVMMQKNDLPDFVTTPGK